MTHKNFAVFILTHGRPDKIYTLKSLKKAGYTGKIYLIIDNEDKTAEQYKEKYKNTKNLEVKQFDKKRISKTFDTADISDDRRSIVYARNYSFELANELKLTYFLQLDDDYTDFRFRTLEGDVLRSIKMLQIEKVFDATLDFLDASNALTITFSQGGDLIGGATSTMYKNQLMRKAMNSFFCRTDRPFKFVGRINEDVNTYVSEGFRGKIMISTAKASLTQKETQQNSGGMTDIYLDSGTYIKSFFTIMYNPSAVKIATIGAKSARLHHKISWRNCTPQFLDEKYKRSDING